MTLWTNNDESAGKPKYLSDADKDLVVGVDIAEASKAENRAKGFKTPGWNKAVTYTDAQGNVRNKVETLVVLSGGMTGDSDAQGTAIISEGTTETWGSYMVHPEADHLFTTISVTQNNIDINLSVTPQSVAALQALPVGTVFTVAAGTGISIGDTFTLTTPFTDQAGWRANVTYSGGGFMGGGMANVSLFTVTTP